MFRPSSEDPALHFWDVPAALLGVAIAGGLSGVPVLGTYGIVWIGGPFAMVALRRTFLPMLTPAVEVDPAPVSLGRRLLAYIFMLVGGTIAMLSGLIFYGAATAAKRPEFAWPFLIVFGMGGMLAALGVRWLTNPRRARS
jgi:hypothetical protein